MSYFQFRQNNSGGHFIGTKLVFVQADNASQANDIAQKHGIYFNGVADGIDCGCCGDRWHRVYDDDAQDTPTAMSYNFANGDYVDVTYADGDSFSDFGDDVHIVKVISK